MDDSKKSETYERVEITPGVWVDMPKVERPAQDDLTPEFDTPLDFENPITRRGGG
jgi:hypothetical protein